MSSFSSSATVGNVSAFFFLVLFGFNSLATFCSKLVNDQVSWNPLLYLLYRKYYCIYSINIKLQN